MEFQECLAGRKSAREFLDREIDPALLESIFERAQQAPSWCNIQPWRVWVTRGERTKALREALLSAADAQTASGGGQAGSATSPTDFPWPQDYPAPYGDLRRECGMALYGVMGIERHDRPARARAWRRNFEAFGAPHIAIVGVDRVFGMYGALDVGCWLQSLLLSLHDAGLAACPQASLALFPEAVRGVLPIPASIGVLCGIAIGYPRPESAINALKTSRDRERSIQFV